MADTKNTEAKKIKPEDFTIPAKDFAEEMGKTMEQIINMSVPKSLAEVVQRMIDEHETNYIVHEDEYAVLDISTASLQKTDCIPGYVDIPRSPAQFTSGGLIVKDRYPVQINLVPVGQEIHEWTIVSKEKWEKDLGDKTGQMLSNEQVVAAQILRTGGSV